MQSKFGSIVRQFRRNGIPLFGAMAFALLFGQNGSLPLTVPVAQAQSAQPEGGAGSTQKDAKSGGGGEKAGQGSGQRRSGGRGRRGRGGRPAVVVVDAVRKGVVVETVQVYGRIIANQTGVVAARSRGAVGGVMVQVGDRVKKGDVLAVLVTDMLAAERALKAAELTEYVAAIERAESQRKLAAQELQRLERLRQSSAFSVARYQDKLRDVERARSALAEAKAKSDQARAELKMADINLYNAKILAPFDGVVSVRHVEVGNYVNVGAPVVSLVNDASLEVEAEVPANRLRGLAPGTVIDVVPESGVSFKASVRAVVPEENALSRTRVVRFRPQLEGNGKFLASNQSVILHIPSGAAKDAVTVHKDAITVRGGKKVAFVVNDEGNRVSLREVQLGEPFGPRFEVIKGLEAGEKVVIRGNERLQPNQRIRLRGGGGGNGEGRRRREGGGNGAGGGNGRIGGGEG